MGGGGGGSVDIPQRSFPQEWQGIKKGYKGQINQFNQFANKEPLLTGASDVALGGLGEVSSLQDPLKKLLGNLPSAQSYIDPLMSGFNQVRETIDTGGRLNTEQQRTADQAALGLSAGAGMANSNAGVAGALLNRDQFRTQRFNTALGQGEELTQLFQGIRGADTAQRLGLTSGIQGVRSQAIAPALATEEGRTGAFSKITNPILAYLSDLNSSNQNAAAAQSIASANQSSGKASGTLGAITSVIGAAATAY